MYIILKVIICKKVIKISKYIRGEKNANFNINIFMLLCFMLEFGVPSKSTFLYFEDFIIQF